MNQDEVGGEREQIPFCLNFNSQFAIVQIQTYSEGITFILLQFSFYWIIALFKIKFSKYKPSKYQQQLSNERRIYIF